MATRNGISTLLAVLVVVATVLVAPLAGTGTAGATASSEWQVSASYPSGDLPQAVSCPTTAECVAVGGSSSGAGTVLVTTTSGATWVPATVPTGVGTLVGVSCPTTSDCVAVGTATDQDGAILTSTDGGTSWTSQTVPSGEDGLEGVSCATVSNCVAVLGYNAPVPVLTTGDGGVTWTTGTVPGGVYGLSGVSCATPSDCVAVGDDGASDSVVASTNGGSTWTVGVVPAGVVGLSGVSCPSAADCAAVGGSPTSPGQGLVSTDGGLFWSAATVPADLPQLASVDCATTSVCTAVGPGSGAGPAAAVTSTDGGATWSASPLPADVDALAGVACPSSLDCFAVGEGATTADGIILAYALPGITTTSLPAATLGTSYSVTLAATGGITPLTWSITTGTLPAGLSLDGTTGVISGTPTATGAVPVTVEVTDGYGATATASLAVIVVTPGAYTAVTAVRICDTRSGNPSALTGPAAQCNGAGGTGSRLAPHMPLTISVAGQFTVPSDATAAVVNVTAINASSAGYVTVYPAGDGAPTASNLNVRAGQNVPNLVEVGLGVSGQLSVVANTSVDVAVDLEGYVTPGETGGAGLYDPLSTPARICDTRAGNPSGLSAGAAQCNGTADAGSRLVGGTPLTVTVDGNGGVPSTGVAAVVLNVTVVNAGGAGYLTAYPAGTTAPTASNLNYAAGETVPNRVIVPVSASGAVSLVTNQPTDVLVDVSGWYTTAGGTGTQFTPASPPVRICDTRPGNASGLVGGSAQCNGTDDAGDPIAQASTLTLNVAGLAGVPSGAAAVVLNVTAVQPTARTYLTVFPSGSPPTVSDLNPSPGTVEPNLVVATLSADGTVSVYNNTGTTNIVVDVAGWYS